MAVGLKPIKGGCAKRRSPAPVARGIPDGNDGQHHPSSHDGNEASVPRSPGSRRSTTAAAARAGEARRRNSAKRRDDVPVGDNTAAVEGNGADNMDVDSDSEGMVVLTAQARRPMGGRPGKRPVAGCDDCTAPKRARSDGRQPSVGRKKRLLSLRDAHEAGVLRSQDAHVAQAAKRRRCHARKHAAAATAAAVPGQMPADGVDHDDGVEYGASHQLDGSAAAPAGGNGSPVDVDAEVEQQQETDTPAVAASASSAAARPAGSSHLLHCPLLLEPEAGLLVATNGELVVLNPAPGRTAALAAIDVAESTIAQQDMLDAINAATFSPRHPMSFCVGTVTDSEEHAWNEVLNSDLLPLEAADLYEDWCRMHAPGDCPSPLFYPTPSLAGLGLPRWMQLLERVVAIACGFPKADLDSEE